MSELPTSVRSSFFHDVISFSDAEARLEGREGAYLFRESDIKSGMFIISFVKNSSVSHIVTPRKDGKYFRQTLEEAVDIAADIISASQNFDHPVPPPSSSPQNSDTEDVESETEKPENMCYCCGLLPVLPNEFLPLPSVAKITS